MGNVILGLLLIGPQTLYSLNKQFEQGISLFYRASYGSLQSALKSLLAKGYVSFVESIDGGRNKKTYTITDAGSAAFDAWMRAPVAGGDLEVAALSKLYHLGLVDDDDVRQAVLDDLVAAITHERNALEGIADQIDSLEVPPEYDRLFRYRRATLDYGIVSHRAGLDWFLALAEEERRR
ncbi:DNA-binding PadR family transcriptional regulator [Agromyces terreus]|uniref:DNA-binding PadR family transcriptional regulator n=1 Tax=Agromyces terreus TaxID=424795 RepID=A0A9X2GYN2_9MICO|nr:PadR family transcriptional regulator [Agromyces terreus]MCP2369861.1 DNA-binding PadR family transcriptional regulator [Agromyces terreus]